MKHRFHSAVLGIAAALLLAGQPAANAQGAEPKKLTPEELKDAMAKEPKPVFLDVREPKELEDLGTLEGYTNIPLGELESRISEVPKDRDVIIACNRAHRAGQAAKIFDGLGKKYIGVVALREWKEKGYDLIYPKAPEKKESSGKNNP